MAFDFILPLSTFPQATATAGLRRAFDLAATLGGRMTALVQDADIPAIRSLLGDVVLDVSTMVAEAEARSRRQGAELVKEVERLAAFFQLPLQHEQIRCRPELVAGRMAELARTHDYALIILQPGEASQRDIAEAVIFDSGGPAILFPAEDVPAHLRTVMIGWDGSRAAARAVRDALPVLRLAGEVLIATFSEEKAGAENGLAALQRYLGGHGIAATHVAGDAGGGRIGAALQELAIARDCGLLVMGAFGRSRLRDFVLGGATRTVLAEPRLPVLLSH